MEHRISFKFKKLMSDAVIPKYFHEGDSGMDLFSNENTILHPKQNQLISTGIAIQLPYGFEGQVRSKSGLSLKDNIRVFGGIGTIDSNYRGEVLVHLENVSFRAFEIRKGDKIAQLVLSPVVYGHYELVDKLDETSRNDKGFGSTDNMINHSNNMYRCDNCKNYIKPNEWIAHLNICTNSKLTL